MKYLFLSIYISAIFMACDDSLNINSEEPIDTPTDTTMMNDPCMSEDIFIPSIENLNIATQTFSFDIFERLCVSSDSNTVISPLSIMSALLMVHEGASCNTYDQITQTLALGDGNSFIEIGNAYNDLIASLTTDTDSVALKSVNALFYDNTRIDIKQSFESKLQSSYSCTVESSDFSNPEAVDRINEWAAENTENRIEEVLKDIKSFEVLFLLNALYFIGDWENGFFEFATRESNFTLRTGEEIMVSMMNHDGRRRTYRDEEMMLVDMAVKGGDFAVSFISNSTETSSIDDLVTGGSFPDRYKDVIANQLSEQRIIFNLPKFELRDKYKLNDVLISMGMSDAFSQFQANLSRMGEAAGSLFVNRVLHDTYIKVDERGIEGAAVTTVGVGVTSLPPSFTFDRPFLFILRHIDSGLPIFIGKVENPLE